MTKSFLPLAKSQISTPDLWSRVAKNWLATGVIKSYLNELLVYAKSDGMQVYVKSGAANVQGIYFDSDAEEVLSIAAADATNPRIDRVIIRLDLTADSIDFAILQGTPAASPTAPALTQNSTRWEASLAQVYVGTNVSTIAAGNITDERDFVKNQLSYKSKPHLHIELTTDYSIPTATDTALYQGNFVRVTNNSGWVDNTNKWIVPKSGGYNITAYLAMEAVATGVELKCQVFHYDSAGNVLHNWIVGDIVSANASKWLYANGTINPYLKVGEQIAIVAYQDSGVNKLLKQARLTAILEQEY